MMQQDILPPITEDDRMLSGLVYPLWPLVAPIVLYSSKRTEPYLHYNALQAIALGGVSTGGALLVFLITWLLMWLMPGSFITFSAVMGIGLFALVLFVILFYLTLVLFIAWRVANGKFLRLPFLGSWAENRMQRNLNITSESYSTAILGERRPKAKLSNFDYRQAPGYVEEEEAPPSGENGVDEFYNPDTDMYEYTSEATSAEDLLSYEQANAPASAMAPSATSPTPARPQGFQAKAPIASGTPAGAVPASDGFKPLSSTFGSKLPPGGSANPAASAPVVAGQRPQGGQFKPMVPPGGNANPAASAPVTAGQRPQGGQFKPMVPPGNSANHATSAPVVAGQRPQGGQFKPMVPPGSNANPAASAPVTAGQRPQGGQFKPMVPPGSSANHAASAPVVAGQRPQGGQFKPMVPQGERQVPASGEFRPGLGSKPRPGNTPSAPRFKWDSLDKK